MSDHSEPASGDPVTEPVNFPEAWQAYFTALDELAKAVIAEREAYEVCGNPNDEYYVPREAALADRADEFYSAWLNLKPYLPDESC